MLAVTRYRISTLGIRGSKFNGDSKQRDEGRKRELRKVVRRTRARRRRGGEEEEEEEEEAHDVTPWEPAASFHGFFSVKVIRYYKSTRASLSLLVLLVAIHSAP